MNPPGMTDTKAVARRVEDSGLTLLMVFKCPLFYQGLSIFMSQMVLVFMSVVDVAGLYRTVS